VVGQRVTARAARTGSDPKTISWRFVVPQGIERDLERS